VHAEKLKISRFRGEGPDYYRLSIYSQFLAFFVYPQKLIFMNY